MSEQFEDFDLNRLLFALRNNIKIFLCVTLGFFILSLLYVFTSTTKYKAQATIYIDPAQAYSVDSINPAKQNLEISGTFLDSQAAIIKSREIAFEVIEKVFPDKASSDIEELYEAVSSRLNVKREDKTYLVNISYTHEDPKIAADIVNSFIKNYIKRQSLVKVETSKKGADWLHERIEELKRKSVEANDELQKFKTEHNIIASSSDRLINQDQLVQMNDQLGAARADTASLKARYEHSRAIIANRDINAAVAQALDNDVINNIRSSYLDRKKRYATLQRSLGVNHKIVRSLKKEISEYEDIIFAEMQRIMRSQFGDYQVSKAREKTLEESLQGLIGVKNQNDSVKAQLVNLEQQAQTYEKLLTTYIQQFEALNQSQTLEFSDTRIISKAVPPSKKNNLSSYLVLTVFTILGAAIGFIIVIYLEVNDRSIRKISDIFNKLQLHSLGIFPIKPHDETAVPSNFIASKSNFVFCNPIFTVGINEPLSIFSETLRKIKTSVDVKSEHKPCKVIGVSSTQANEGKSTISINLSSYLASTGKKTLYLDMDIRHPILNYHNFETPIVGLGDFIEGHSVDLNDFIVHKDTGLHIIPAVGKNLEVLQSQISREFFKNIIEQFSSFYDYIVIDFPPLEMTADIEVTSDYIDHFILIAQWAKTSSVYIKQVLNQSPILRSKTLGMILNKVDMHKFSLLNNQPHYYEYYDL